MRTFALIISTLIITSAVAAELSDKTPVSNKQQQSNIGTQTISLGEFKGSVLVLYAFEDDMDNWSKPVRQLNSLKKEFAGKNVRVGAFTGKSKKEIDDYMKTIDFLVFTKSIDFTVLSKSSSKARPDIKRPCVFLIGPDSRIRWQGKTLVDVGERINKILNESTVEKTPENISTNVSDVTIKADVMRFTNAAPVSQFNDSDGIAVPKIPEGTVITRTPKPAKEKRTGSAYPVQRIDSAPITPGIKSDQKRY